MGSYIDGKLRQLRQLFTSQSDPNAVAAAVCAGAFGGLFPVPFLTTCATIVVCALLRLLGVSHNAPIALAVNMLLTAPSLMLIYPHMVVGFYAMGSEAPPLSPSKLSALIAADGALATVRAYASAFAVAVVVWCCTTPLYVCMCFLLRSILSVLYRRKDARKAV